MLDTVPSRLAMVGLALATVIGLRVTGVVDGPGADAGPERPIVLVSGRDDHGFLAQESVTLLASPAAEGDGEPVAEVPDGTLVRVLGDDGGTWLEVATLDGTATGWVDDFFLRGTAHVVAVDEACPAALRADVDGPVLAALEPSEQVELVDDHTVDGVTWVGVRTLTDQLLGMVPAERLRELPGTVAAPGQDCVGVEPDPQAQPHQH